MESSTYEDALDRAAQSWGIQPSYWDIWGQRHVTPPETKCAILESLGIRTDTKRSLDLALERRLREEWSRLAPPCLVISENQQRREFGVRMPVESGGLEASISVKLESGSSEVYSVALADLPETGAAEVDGHRHIRKEVPLPASLPLGYHDLEIMVGGASAQMRLIIAPDRAYLPDGLRSA